jgi:hypothetical protein
LRRIIRAFAIRTASVLGVCFFDSRVFGSVSAVGIMRNCMGAIEPCSTGCTLMGPVDVDLFLGTIDNALLPSSFDRPSKKPRPFKRAPLGFCRCASTSSQSLSKTEQSFATKCARPVHRLNL